MARINGEGSWGKKNIKGNEYIRYRVSIDGKQKDFYGKTKTEAMQKYKEFRKQHVPGIEKTTLTLCDVARKAVEAKKPELKATTYDFYLYAIKSLDQSGIGALQIHSVKQADVQNYLNEMVDKNSFSMIKRQKILLSVTFGYAEDNDLVKKNFMSKVKLPNKVNLTKQEKEHIILTTEERKVLEEEAKRLNDSKVHNGKIGDPLYGVPAKAIIFILHTGLRMGELIGLWWEDVDMKEKSIHIKRNAPTMKREVTTPKRKSSIRTVPLDETALGIIKELSEDKCGDFVFHTKTGMMLNRGDVDRALKQMVRRSGLEKKPTLHDLRHTYASELIRNGVDMKTVSVILGHADISTTMNIYVHKSDADLDVVRSILD